MKCSWSWYGTRTILTIPGKAINNHVSNLRKKIRIAPDLPEYVKSVYGIGYKFDI